MNSENNKRAKRGLGALLGTEISIDGKKVSVLSVEIEKIKFTFVLLNVNFPLLALKFRIF